MIIVGEDLQQLLIQYNITDRLDSFDQSSLSLRLGRRITRYEVDETNTITYGRSIPDTFIEMEDIADDFLILSPDSRVLGCSRETIYIPLGYIGFVTTKSSLARIYVSIQCDSPFIDPGFRGKITFEIHNRLNCNVRIPVGIDIARMSIIKTSTKQMEPYNGRYKDADRPLPYRPE